MTYTKYVTLCALFAQADASLTIEIDQDKIQKVGMDFIGWVGGQAQNAGNLRVARDLNTVAHKAQLRIDLRQKDIFAPVINNWSTYLKFLNKSNKNCNEQDFISCAIKSDSGVFEKYDEDSCAEQSQCHISIHQLDQADQEKLQLKLGKNQQESVKQMNKVGQKIRMDLMEAFQKNAQQVMTTAMQTQKKIQAILKEWGCDSSCVDECTASPMQFQASQGCSQCSCPAPFEIRQNFGEYHNYYQHQFEQPAYNLYGHHGYHGHHGYQGHHYHGNNVPNHHYHYEHYDHPSYTHHYTHDHYHPNYVVHVHPEHHTRVVHVHHYGPHSYASDEKLENATTNLYSSGEDPSNNYYHYGYAGHNQYGPMPMERYNQTESYYGVQNYGPHQYHSYMDAFTVSNLLSSACDHPSLCGAQTAQSLNGFPGFDVQGPAQNTGAQSSQFPGFQVHGPAANTGAQSSQFPGFQVNGPAANTGAQSEVHGMPDMNTMSYNSPPHVDMALFAGEDMNKFDKPKNSEVCDIPELCPGYGPSMGGDIKDTKLNLSAAGTCDIPELCPGVGPSMGGAIVDQKLALATCDIPELCPGVGPSMGGFNVGKLSSLSQCTIPELCIVGNDVASLAQDEESTHFTQAEIKHFKETQTFYSGIGISNKRDGSYIDYQTPYFAFTPVESKSWVSATTVLCSIGLIGAGYVALTKKQQADEESFQVEMA